MPKLIDIIIPALNEAPSIGKTVAGIPRDMIRHIIVCDNGSTDGTAVIAMQAGAIVVSEPQRGYGFACLKGIEYLSNLSQPPEILVFMDGDCADDPNDLMALVQPIIDKKADMVIGSRTLGKRERGALTPQQIFGNALAVALIRLLYGYHFTDLGPFRAIHWDKLLALEMQDKTYGWTVEMQVKAAKQQFICTEIPVRYRRRIGGSKVSGTIKGVVMAGSKILWTIFKEFFSK
jgi:glycosyltransferase involved in cell wall biosynthesis